MNLLPHQRRAVVICCFFVIGLTGLSGRLILVQLFHHEEALAQAKRGAAKRIIPAERGEIFDRNGVRLAGTEPLTEVNIDRFKTRKSGVTVARLSAYTGIPERKLRALSNEGFEACYLETLAEVLHRPLGKTKEEFLEYARNHPGTTHARYVVGREIDAVAVVRMKQNLRGGPTAVEAGLGRKPLAGVEFLPWSKRRYYGNHLLAHILGYVQLHIDGTGEVDGGSESEEDAGSKTPVDEATLGGVRRIRGVEGVEKTLEAYLAGKDGVIHLDRLHGTASVVPPEAGENVRLTIDAGLQMIVERVMEKYGLGLNPEWMSVILMDPDTGEVLALANYPWFDPGAMTSDPSVRVNHAIRSTYDPGSIFKVAIYSAVFDTGSVDLETPVNCHGGYYQTRGMKALSDVAKRGVIPVREAIQISSNIAAAKMAFRLGSHTLYNYLRNFGIDETSGIRLTAENRGELPHPDDRIGWSGATTTSRIAIGYGVSATPFQMLRVLGVVCNDGFLLKPRIVLARETPDGAVIERTKPERIRQVVSPQAAKMMREALVQVVEKGTGRRARIEGYLVGGKTGTAFKSHPEGGYYNGKNGRPKRYFTSFMGFLPADKPRLAGIVVVNDPKTEEHIGGGTIAAPIFNEIAREAMVYMGVIPSDLEEE